MRYGFTTGSCAAAASKAAVYMLLTGKEKQDITIETPKGITFHAQIVDIKRAEKWVSCAVIKDGGDDPDVTTGAHIVARVSIDDITKQTDDCEIKIDGGAGVGRVTKPGLDQPVGNAAINHVPRQMIEEEVRQVCEICDFKGKIDILISVPEGEEIAKNTFNPHLGVVSGISILGTSGIVEPMSSQALLDTIEVEIRQKRAMGYKVLAVSPGNYGLDFMKNTYGYDLELSVKCSNFIGATIDMARDMGFEKMLLTGHIGKLVKVAGGMMNTHSKEGDCRLELMSCAALVSGADNATLLRILDCVTTEEAIAQIKKAAGGEELFRKTMDYLIEKIYFYLNKRATGKLNVECIMYSNDYGELARSRQALEYLEQLRNFS